MYIYTSHFESSVSENLMVDKGIEYLLGLCHVFLRGRESLMDGFYLIWMNG